jgi:beta-galactosidase/beta-glucuronidase
MSKIIFLALVAVTAQGTWTRPKCGTPNTGQDIISSWGKAITPDTVKTVFGYPRPQMMRDASSWSNMNGLWEWQSATSSANPPFGKTLSGEILVPFPVEACLSGIGANHPQMWYRTTFDHAATGNTLLHFGAVDWMASVYLNGKLLGNHTGGYDGFSFDITKGIKATGNELIVYVMDPSDSGPQPQGKQRVGSIAGPGGDHYTPSSGIWQTVWLESVEPEYISSLKIGADEKSLSLEVHSPTAGQKFTVNVMDGSKVVATGSGMTSTDTANTAAAISVTIPSPKLWSPDTPFLYNMTIIMGKDSVTSYFGMRTFKLGMAAGANRPLLNDKFVFANGWLDQSWWPDGQYTAPGDAALASDQKAVKMFGMNMVRLHQKVNPEVR